MKSEKTKGFISGVLVMVVLLSLIGTAAATVGRRTVDVDYCDIKVTLNGDAVSLVDIDGNAVEPFAINGTTYLPVRAVSTALGLDVDWNSNTSTVELTDTGFNNQCSIQMLGFYKTLEESFIQLEDKFNAEINGIAGDTIHEKLSSGPYAGYTIAEATKMQLEESLVTVNSYYNECYSYLKDSDIALVSEYRRLNSLALAHFNFLSANGGTANSVMTGAATQAWVDCMGYSASAQGGFWLAYLILFN